MTHRGSLAYYLAAWVCGCSFMVLAFWLETRLRSRAGSQDVFGEVSFLGLCFFGLFLGAAPSLLFGWVLRKVLSRARGESVWIWALSGAVVAILLIWSLGSVGRVLRDPRFLPYSALPIWPFFVVGPLTILDEAIWLALPVGVATASVLFAVNRAFAQNAEAQS